jgi:D-glycero-alpha-D-manno-heptose-7-phosphate kinase
MTTSLTPLRLTFGGGGSDLTLHRGTCITSTISHHIRVTVTPCWDPVYRLHYSHFEEARRPTQIEHRIIRRAVELFDIPPGIEITSTSVIPGGTGLGNSGAFTVGLLRALHPTATRHQLAEWACQLDIGQQDQWAAVWGGWTIFDFGEGILRPFTTPLTADDFCLYYTGLHHNSAQILTGPGKVLAEAENEIAVMVPLLEQGDLASIGLQFQYQWNRKLSRCPSVEHQQIDRWITQGIQAGAYGGKLIGAGNGGFILFAGPVDDDAMIDLTRLPFQFTDEGTRCV